jgi:hypothetical protein
MIRCSSAAERSSPKGVRAGSSPVTGALGEETFREEKVMPKVEVTLSSMDDINFEVKKVFKYDDEEWEEMTPAQREETITEDAEGFKNSAVDWDYKVLS